MAGLYIHIPFCKSRCVYCGFYSTTALNLRRQYVDALCREIGMRHESHQGSVGTVYLGGGTPSQLTIPQLQQIFEAVYKYNNVAADAEVTIECNPDDVTPSFVEDLKSLPVNRVSMGAQTFSDDRLHFLRRRHTASQVVVAVERLRSIGIANISIDLIYGFPEETTAEWEHDIEAALALGAEHISAYCLMIEEGTPLHRLQQEGRISETDEEQERQMYEILIDRLEAAGYEHYEISNFARPGLHARHNAGYWDGTPYIGIGAAAHSYDIRTRSWNVSDIHRYIEGINSGQRDFKAEQLDDDTRYNDAVTTALRTRKGLNLSALSERHRAYCLQNARHFLDDNLLRLSDDGTHLSLTHRGLFVSDMVMSDLMFLASPDKA